MSQPPQTANRNGFDPAAAVRGARDSWLDGWSKAAVQFVNTETYAQLTGLMLNSYLTLTAPYRQALTNAMTQTLAALNMPSRNEIATLGERLTNIETRLDDLDASLDDLKRRLPKSTSSKAPASPPAEDR